MSGPDYRCVMCDAPIAVACRACTQYAYESVGWPTRERYDVSKVATITQLMFYKPDGGFSPTEVTSVARFWLAMTDDTCRAWSNLPALRPT